MCKEIISLVKSTGILGLYSKQSPQQDIPLRLRFWYEQLSHSGAEMEKVFKALRERVKREPYAGKLGMELVEVKPGYARIRMPFGKDIENIFGMAHGGAVFSLIDEAFQIASNSHGTVSVALNVQVSYIQAAEPGETLFAEMKEITRSTRLSHCAGEVKDSRGRLIATCQAIAYRKKDRLPFLE